MNKTVGIYTLGCKVNQYESEAIGEALERLGFSLCPPNTVCDLYIINTCTVTAESDRKARQFIRRALSKNPEAFVLVTGCMAQTSPEDIAGIPGVDYIGGNRNKMSVVEAAVSLCRQERKNDKPIVDVPPLDGADFEAMSICRFGRTRAYIKIEDGCESRCTYCIIPSARGHIRSKPMEDVLSEVRDLTDAGCREVVLTGIETASWGRDLGDVSLADLLEAVDAIPGIGRVRLGSLDPTLMRPAFVERIAKLSSLAPHFHLSMQSGSDAVLARMKRKYNRTQALAAIERLHSALPDVMLTTDIIVGFPGETEEDFEATMDLARRARFLMIHVFPYSKRQGTPAAVMPDQVPGEIKKQRVAALSALSADIRREILTGLIEKKTILPVLFETYTEGTAVGHTPNFIEVHVPVPTSLHAQTHNVRLVALTEDGTGCIGQLC
jgi:threonylcarbamoyladenosine tRNA methylthiotransferase MtaB